MRPDYEGFRDAFNGLEQTQIDFETQGDGEVRGRQSSQRRQHSEGTDDGEDVVANRTMSGEMEAAANQGPLLLSRVISNRNHKQRDCTDGKQVTKHQPSHGEW
jgi:hypothetical protein